MEVKQSIISETQKANLLKFIIVLPCQNLILIISKFLIQSKVEAIIKAEIKIPTILIYKVV